jgi:branched-subunit amino acid ABC-type transport system permease component
MPMDQVVVLLIAIASGVAVLTLISLGLAVIFGMMRVINFAHGEFIMLGGYATVVATAQGVNIWIAMLVIAPLTVGLVGIVAERLIIRRFYGQLVTTLLATWGLSLFLIGSVTAIFGNTTRGVAAPLGSVPIGAYSVSAYQLVLIAITTVLAVGCLIALHRTRWGLIARGTMRNPAMASTLGIDPVRVYAATFTLGAALSGLAGGLLAPLSGVIPYMGSAYVARAFVTVISGGSSLVLGTVSAAALFGPLEALFSFLATPVVGQAAVLIAAILLLRLMPQGISASWQGGRR